MNDLILPATQYTPQIEMCCRGSVSIQGKSYPENTLAFYQPVMAWLRDWVESSTESELRISFHVSYFNSSSSKLFFELFDVLNENRSRFSIVVLWHYDAENESALEAGEDFVADFPDLVIQLVTLTV